MKKLAAPKCIVFAEKSTNHSVFDVKWIPNSARFVSVGTLPNNHGNLSIWGLDSDGKKTNLKLNLSTEHSHGMKCASFDSTPATQRNVAVGDFVGDLHVFDLEKLGNNYEGSIFTVTKAHDGLIHSLDAAGFEHGPPEILTGGSDGCVRVWDIRQKQKPVLALEPADAPQADNNQSTLKKNPDCWAVAFGNCYNDSNRVIAAGYENGDLKIFDMRKGAMLFETNVGNGICSLEFDRKDINLNKLLATTLEGKMTIFDLRTFNPEEGYANMNVQVGETGWGKEFSDEEVEALKKNKEEGFEDFYDQEKKSAKSSTVWSGKHLPQNREVFMVSGGSGHIYLYKYVYPPERFVGKPPRGVMGKAKLLSTEQISTQGVFAVDWNKHKEGLGVASSFDQTVKVFAWNLHNIE